MEHQVIAITPELESKCWAWALQNNSAIKDKHAFEDAQIMARLAVLRAGLVEPESFWFAAMQALKTAYKGK